MSQCDRRRRRLPALVAGARGVGCAFGLGTAVTGAEPTQQELMDEVRALRAKVEQLEAAQQKQQQQQQQPGDQPTAKQVDATVDSVLRDADSRSNLLQAPGFT